MFKLGRVNTNQINNEKEIDKEKGPNLLLIFICYFERFEVDKFLFVYLCSFPVKKGGWGQKRRMGSGLVICPKTDDSTNTRVVKIKIVSNLFHAISSAIICHFNSQIPSG